MTTTTAAQAERDQLIRTAHTFGFVPACRTVLVKFESWPRAVRMMATDAEAIARTADSASQIKRTVHRGRSAETVATEYHWNDGVRIRITEQFSI